MKNCYNFIILLIFCFSQNFSLAWAADASKCTDDTRLVEIGTLIANPQGITAPITVTPETYLQLNSEVLQALYGKMLICPDNPILPSGKPLKKITVEFELIMDKINQAVINGDYDSIKLLTNTLQPTSIPPQELASLFTLMPYTVSNIRELYGVFGVKAYTGSYGAVAYYVDVFLAFGGKVSKGGTIYYSLGSINSDKLKELPENAILLQIPFIEAYREDTVKHIDITLRKLGFNPVAL